MRLHRMLPTCFGQGERRQGGMSMAIVAGGGDAAELSCYLLQIMSFGSNSMDTLVERSLHFLRELELVTVFVLLTLQQTRHYTEKCNPIPDVCGITVFFCTKLASTDTSKSKIKHTVSGLCGTLVQYNVLSIVCKTYL